MASETDPNRGPEGESLESLPPELRIYVPAEGTPVEPVERAEPSYEEVPLASLSGTAQPPQPAPAEPTPAKGVGLPSKFSLIALAAAAIVLVSVPFVIALLMTGDREDEHVAIGMNAPQPQEPGNGPLLSAQEPPPETPVDALPAEQGEPVRTEPDTPEQNAGPPPVEQPTRVSLVAGPGCANNAQQKYEAVGYYSNGTEGWYTRSGGSTEAGCRGSFDAMPMSGEANTSDSQHFGKWAFDVSGDLKVADCALSVYIPNDSDRRNVGATAAHYSIFNSFDQGGANVIAVKDVDQVANLGKWVDLGTHRIDQGKLSIKLHNRGEDYKEGADGEGAHVAVTQIRANCTPA
ncbi:hypothetical protein [Saccharopolyspora sp. NPDC002686]|uniref:hypothetical protein n=1 Tax=Saccharopolyspora sp. NPDC002686 TaxID=3154541 RepID=UPI003324888C